MKGKIKSIIIAAMLLAILLIEPLYLKIVIAQEYVTSTQDDTSGVWLFSAGTTIPAGAPTCPIIERAVFYGLFDYIGDSPEEVYDFGWGPSEPTSGQEDKTLAKVIQGLSAIDDFGYLADANDDTANFDTGKSGYFLGGFDPATSQVIVSDGVKATGVLGPSGATSLEEAEEAINGYEIFIFEDAELSGMIVTLSNSKGLSITFSIADLQVNPPTLYGADDTMIAIDLDNMTGFDGTFIDTIRIQDDGITSPSTYGDTTLEIDAIAVRKPVKRRCPVVFFTDPSTIGNITFEGVTYTNGQSDTFPYGTSGLAYANAPTGWAFDHWITMGNVQVSNTTANPTTFTIKCGGNLTAVFKQVQCLVKFYTDPCSVGNITFKGVTYTCGQSDTFPYGTSGLATANAPAGWVFDHWVTVGNVEVSSTTSNPTTFTIRCGGELTAVFIQRGTGDFGTIGYWKHVFYVWKTGKGTFKEYIEAILEDYLERINATSTVFSENYTLTMNSAYDLLWNHDSSMRTRALKQCLASWLNWADGATTMTQMVDTNYDGIPDMTFGDAMEIVEDILRDSNSSWEDLEYAKNICDSINNM